MTSRASKKKVSGRPYLVEFPRVSILSPYVFGLLAVADEKTFAEFLCINHDVLSRFEETMRIASLGCQLQFGDSPTDVVLESVGSDSAISFDETVIGQLSIRRGDAETVIKLLDGLLEMVVGVMDKIPVGLLLTRFEKLLFLSKTSCRLSNFLSLVVGCSAFSSDSPPICGNDTIGWMACNPISFGKWDWKLDTLHGLYERRFENGKMPCNIKIFGEASRSQRMCQRLKMKAECVFGHGDINLNHVKILLEENVARIADVGGAVGERAVFDRSTAFSGGFYLSDAVVHRFRCTLVSFIIHLEKSWSVCEVVMQVSTDHERLSDGYCDFDSLRGGRSAVPYRYYTQLYSRVFDHPVHVRWIGCHLLCRTQCAAACNKRCLLLYEGLQGLHTRKPLTLWTSKDNLAYFYFLCEFCRDAGKFFVFDYYRNNL